MPYFHDVLKRAIEAALAEALEDLLDEKFKEVAHSVDDLRERIQRLPCSERRSTQ